MTELIFYMKMLKEKNVEWNKKSYATVKDLEKVFESVKRERLWGAVLEDQVYNLLLRTCTPINRVRRGGGSERLFGVKTGMIRGNVLPPMLFALLMD